MTTTDEEYIAKIIKVYNALENKIREQTICQGDCIIRKKPINGYNLGYNGKTYAVTSLIYMNFYKIKPEIFGIQRNCGTSTCLNPKHLVLQTKEVNFDAEWTRLSARGTRDTKTNCLLWTLTLTKCGYGSAWFNGTMSQTHIISYKIKTKNVTVPKIDKNGNKLCIRHMCTNRHCYEPTHLELGTLSQNHYEDKIKSGTIVRGSKHPNSSITEELAKKIKHSKYPKDHELYKSRKERAEEFGVYLTMINDIDQGKSWGHMPDRAGNVIDSRKKNKKSKKIEIWTPEMFLKTKEKIGITHTKNTDSDCWIWNLAKNIAGYGEIYIMGQRKQAHIASCEAKYGYNTPKGQVVRHMCDNPSCVNPDHLEFGTCQQNSLDAVKSERNKNFTSAAIVKEIRRTYKKDGLTRKERSIKYKICESKLKNIELGKSFKHLL